MEYKQPTWDELDELEEMLLDVENDPEYRKEDWILPGEQVLSETIEHTQAQSRLERKKLKALIRCFQLLYEVNQEKI